MLVSNVAHTQSTKNLLGLWSRDSLIASPYKNWFEPNYKSYLPDVKLIEKLRKVFTPEVTIEIYFGTWCSDSKRDVPRFFKILDEVSFSDNQIKLIAVDADENYKQSPGGETVGKGIYRVATFRVLKNGVELGRITEHPVYTLEDDLLKILSGTTYEPNFHAYKFINQWLSDKVLTNPNVSLRGLAKQLKPLLISSSELNSCVQVLVAQNSLKEAIALAKINAYIFYDNAEAYATLAKALSKDKQQQEALDNIEYAIQLNKNDDELRYLLESYYGIRSDKE
ncbi:MAG: thioredoxin [Cytophagia bacterium]|nr:thioredoxin [Cytophagia bacterium]